MSECREVFIDELRSMALESSGVDRRNHLLQIMIQYITAKNYFLLRRRPKEYDVLFVYTPYCLCGKRIVKYN